MKRVTKMVLGAGALGGAVLAALFGSALYTGPRMKVQPHFRTYQWAMPMPPAGAVPMEPAVVAAGTTAAEGPGAGAAERGAIYYRYYCLHCHGEDGRGRGPVGESYFPAPPDLTQLQRPPRALHTGMLTGAGHSPVLERVVRPEYRWDLVAYLQSLRESAARSNAE